MPNIFERPVTGSIRNALSYKQYISSKPYMNSKYMAKTPFVRVSSNAVQIIVPGADKNKKKQLTSVDIDRLQEKYQSSYASLIEDVNQWLSTNSDLKFYQTNYSFISKVWSPIVNGKPVTQDLQRFELRDNTKLQDYTWSDIFSSESINFEVKNDHALKTSIILNRSQAIIDSGIWNEDTKTFKYEEFFNDASFSFSDFINVLILSQLDNKKKQFFKIKTTSKKSYYIIRTIPSNIIGQIYNDDFIGSPSPIEFFVDVNDMNKFSFGYDIIEDRLRRKFELTKIYYFYAKLGIDSDPILPQGLVANDLQLDKMFQFDDTLAKDNVLQAITSERIGEDEYEIPGGIRAFEEDKSFDENESRNARKNTYGAGLRPRAGIVAFEISTKGDKFGAIRKGKLTIKAFTVEQLETIQKLYMRPGIFLFIEWGWTLYPELKEQDMPENEFSSRPLKPNRERIQFFNTNQYKDSVSIINKTKQLVNNTFGHYDATFGVVSNYNWTLNNAGEFDITVDITAHGTSIMSFKPSDTIQSILNGEYEPFGIFRKLKELTEESGKVDLKNENGKDYIKLGTILDALSEDISGIKTKANTSKYEGKNDEFIAKDLFSIDHSSDSPDKKDWTKQNEETKKEYLTRAEETRRSLEQFKRTIKTVSNVCLNNKPINVVDINNKSIFLTSIKPDKVLFINTKNKKRILGDINVSCFGSSGESSGKKFVSDIDLKEVIFVEKKDTFKEAVYKQANSVDAFLKALFGVIKDASAEVINLSYTIGNDENSSEKIFGSEEIHIFDVNTQDYSFIDKEKDKNSLVKDKPFMISLNSTSTLVKDFSFASRLPTSFQRAAFVSSTNIAQSTVGRADSVDAMLEAFSGGYKNNYNRFSYIPTLNVVDVVNKMEIVDRKVRYELFFKKLMTDNSDITKFEEHKNEEFMNEFRYYYYRQLMGAYKQVRKDALKGKDPEFMIPPVGINLSITIDGTSGIPWGSLFRVDYLPMTLQKKNRKPTFFVTEIVDTINENGWNTKLNLLLRSMEEA